MARGAPYLTASKWTTAPSKLFSIPPELQKGDIGLTVCNKKSKEFSQNKQSIPKVDASLYHFQGKIVYIEALTIQVKKKKKKKNP